MIARRKLSLKMPCSSRSPSRMLTLTTRPSLRTSSRRWKRKTAMVRRDASRTFASPPAVSEAHTDSTTDTGKKSVRNVAIFISQLRVISTHISFSLTTAATTAAVASWQTDRQPLSAKVPFSQLRPLTSSPPGRTNSFVL